MSTELPSYSAERLAANHPTRTDASILSGPYTPTYIAAAEIERLNRAISDANAEWEGGDGLKVSWCSTPAVWAAYMDPEGRICYGETKREAINTLIDEMFEMERREAEGHYQPQIDQGIRENNELSAKLRESTDYAGDRLDALNGLIGLVQIVCARPDMPQEIRQAIADNHRWVTAGEVSAAAKRESEIGQSPTALLSGGPEFNGVLPQRIPAVGIPYIVREPSGQCWGPFPSDKAALAWAEKAGIETCDFDDVMSPYPVPSQGLLREPAIGNGDKPVPHRPNKSPGLA